MTDRRKIIVYIATSADGFIARRDGSVDWLNRPRTAGDYGMADFEKSIDAIIWGRTTFDEAVVRFGGKVETMADPKSNITNYVITHRPSTSLPGLEFVKEPLTDFVQRLLGVPGKDVWVMGGGGVIASLLDIGGIDEFIIHVIPIFIGEGTPLLAPQNRTVKLELLGTKSWPDGVVKLHYKVLPRRVSRKGKKATR